MSDRARGPIGVVLAGGAGRRIGGSKAQVLLRGRPLIHYPLAVLRAALDEVAVVAKGDTELPELGGVELWIEPDEPRHPLAGILHGLRRAGGRAVLACAADMPLITAEAVELLLGCQHTTAPAVVPTCDGVLEPLFALYRPAALDPLAALGSELPMRAAVEAIGPQLVEMPRSEVFLNVNTEADLALAEALLDASRR